jgi:lysophospholipase L1-like esterase
MYVLRTCLALTLAALAAACTQQLPTGPSPVPMPTVANGEPSHSTSSDVAPPRIGITPPGALGATRFVAFGDSITWGATSAYDGKVYMSAAGGGYAERLDGSLNFFHSPQRFTVINEGVPGELATQALSRFRSVLTTRRPQVVLLLEGINDLANDISPSRAVAGLRQLLDAAEAVKTPVVIATMFQTYEITDSHGGYRTNGAPYVPEFNAELRRMATGRQNVFVIDLYNRMNNRDMVGGDGVHLTDAGFDAMAAAFLFAIEQSFPVRGSFH